jgi:hypothetical protein
MAFNQFHPALFDPFMLWTDLAMKTTEMMVSSGEVIGERVDQIARAGANPSARDMKEIALMGTEKVKAATDSSLAIATQIQAANLQLFARAWQQWFTSLGALAALGSSRSFGEVLARQDRLFNSLTRSARTQGQISGGSARLMHAAIKPVHAAATGNARRFARAKKRRS